MARSRRDRAGESAPAERIVNDAALDILFRSARSHRVWLERPVSPTLLRALWELAKLGPTSANSSPARIVFATSRDAKARLAPALAEDDLTAAMAAPVTAIVGYDVRFHRHLPRLYPQDPELGPRFANDDGLARTTALQNGSLQGGYLIIAARALGLDCGLVSAFDKAAVDRAFFPDSGIEANFLCNLGYGDGSNLPPRNPRLDFDEACRIL